MSNTDSLIAPAKLLRAPPAAAIARKHDVGYATIDNIDQDTDLAFPLRGQSYNPLVNGALPLFGLVIRLRKMDRHPNVEALYATVRDQIASLDEEMLGHGYDSATLLAFRYALCSFIDEAVMSTSWGSHSVWAARSLLSAHHNETWGGEKFFTVLSRMMMDAARYRDVLEFKYLCLCLGFKGKYGLQHNQTEALQGLIKKLHDVLRDLRGDAPEQLTDANANIVSRRYTVRRQWPLWTPWLIAVFVLALVYVGYAISLNTTTNEVLRSLDAMLSH